MRERSTVVKLVDSLTLLSNSLTDASELMELAIEEADQETLDEIGAELDMLHEKLADLEFRRMFSGELDDANAYLDIQFGEGGTEAQDWAEMLLRMYQQWCENHDRQYKLIDYSKGDVAGIRNATLLIKGEYAYGWLRTESGVHRLVRNSPFDSGHRRHTSFASVFVYAEVSEDIAVEIDPNDVRTDTYRSSGAGGQHVNVTDSAVRLTHVPTGTVVQCQSERSQHQNRAHAWNQLRAKLHQLAVMEKEADRRAREAGKPNIGFGSQIRSYVMDQSRVKDLRVNTEHSEPDRVLNGEIDSFLIANLKAGL